MPASPALRAAALLTLILACTVRPLPGDSATEATGGPVTTGDAAPTTAAPTTTGPSTTSTATTTAPASSEPATTQCNFLCGPDFVDPPPLNNCDPWILPSPDCPRGFKCTIENDISDTHCVEIVPDPKGLYEPCTILMGDSLSGYDDCDAGLICWNVDPDTGLGQCIGMCQGPLDKPTCADPNTTCTLCQTCEIGLCFPGCDPLAQDCGDGDLCVPNPNQPGFLCVVDASGDAGKAFDPCEFINTCDPGLVCADPSLAGACDPMAPGCCLPFCDLSMPTCPGDGLTCAAWFEPGMAPAGLEDLGLCRLPP